MYTAAKQWESTVNSILCMLFHFSGVKPVDKREGSGAHNWGTYKDDVE